MVTTLLMRGEGAQTQPPRPTPRLGAQNLTDADQYSMMIKASVASLRW